MQSLIFYCFLHHQEWFIWKIFILYSSCSSTGKYSNPEKCRITPLRRITPRRITPHNEMALAFKVCICRHSFSWLLINFSFRFTSLPALSYLWISGSVILSNEVLSVKVPEGWHRIVMVTVHTAFSLPPFGLASSPHQTTDKFNQRPATSCFLPTEFFYRIFQVCLSVFPSMRIKFHFLSVGLSSSKILNLAPWVCKLVIIILILC